MKQNFYTSYRTIRRIFILLMLTLSLLPMQSRGKTIVYDDTNSSNYIQLDFSADYGTADYLCMYILDNKGNIVDIAGYGIVFMSNSGWSENQINDYDPYSPWNFWSGNYKYVS